MLIFYLKDQTLPRAAEGDKEGKNIFKCFEIWRIEVELLIFRI